MMKEFSGAFPAVANGVSCMVQNVRRSVRNAQASTFIVFHPAVVLAVDGWVAANAAA